MGHTKRKASLLPITFLLLCGVIENTTAGDVFSKLPTSKLVREGSKAEVVFECRAGDALPNPVYTWKKDNRILDLNPNITGKHELINGDLTIKSPTKWDAGSYRCSIESETKKAISDTATLTFQYLRGPSENIKNTKTIAQGVGVKLECGAVDYAPEFSIYYTWENPGSLNRIPPGGKKGVYVSQINGDLYFANPQVLDSGTYQCTPITVPQLNIQRLSQSYNTARLDVQPSIGEHEPQFMVTPAATTEAMLNGVTYLECFASGNPTPTITWTKDGSGILPSSAEVSPSGQLFFRDVTEDAVGRYTCTASNHMDSISASGDLVLKYPPRWTEEISSKSFDLESDVTFKCAANAVPAASYRWYKDGEEMNPSEWNIRDEEGYSTLSISRLQREHEGIYQCVAENTEGDIVSAANLGVNSYVPNIEPELDSLIYASFGGRFRIYCNHTAAPAAEVTWLKDNVIIENMTRFEILDDASLLIHSVLEEDKGDYECILTNSLGSDKSMGSLRVYGPTRITKSPDSVSIESGQTAELECEAEHDEALEMVWIWKHNNREVDLMFNPHYFEQDGRLQIREATGEQSGAYTCCASTKVGTPCVSANVSVTDIPEPPVDIKVVGTTSKTQELKWTAGFNNYAPITEYIVQHRNSYDGDKWSNAKTVPKIVNSTRCVVEGLYPYNEYSYRIYAVNEVGMSEHSQESAEYETTKGVPAKAPSRLGGGGGEIGQLVVTWKPLSPKYFGSDNVGYMLAIKKKTDSEDPALFPNLNINETSVDVASVEPGWEEYPISDGKTGSHTFKVDESEIYTPYNVKIQAINDVGKGKWSAIREVRTFEIAPNTAPQNVHKYRSSKAYEAYIEWDRLISDNGRVEGYEVEVKDAAGPITMKPKCIKTRNGVNKAKIEGLANNQVYQVRVSGYNGAGEGPFSTVYEFSTAKKPPSKAPNNFVVSIDGRRIRAEWDAISNSEAYDEEPLSGYKVEYWMEGLSSQLALPVDAPDNHVTFDLPRDGKFNIWVKGVSAGGDGPTSDIKYVSTESVAPPGYIHCCGANTVRFNGLIIMVVTLLWMFFIKLDL